MLFVTRAQWSARPPKGSTGLNATGGVALHWEGPHMGVFSHDVCDDKIRGIQNYHMDVRKWDDIAYNFVVCPHGYVFEGRGYGKRSAAQGTNDGNNRYYAVCYLSGIDDAFTSLAKQGFIDIIVEIRKRGAGQEVIPHSDFRATACPGPAIRSWIATGIPFPPTGVKPMFDPAECFASIRTDPTNGGWIAVKPDGAIFNDEGSVYWGAPNGKPYWGTRKAARIIFPQDNNPAFIAGYQYMVQATDGAVYGYPE